MNKLTLIILLLFAKICFAEPEVIKVLEQACDSRDNPISADVGAASACYRLGNIYIKGEGVPINKPKSSEYYEKGCEARYSPVGAACIVLGLQYFQGVGVQQDYFKAVEYLKDGLDEGDDEKFAIYASMTLGTAYEEGLGVRQSYREALKYFGFACDMRFQDGCSNYARLKKKGVEE